MKSLKVNLLNKDLIINDMSPSATMDKSMNITYFSCCMIMYHLCCCTMNGMCILYTCLCKIINKNYEYIKYRTTVIFMKYFINTTVVFCV